MPPSGVFYRRQRYTAPGSPMRRSMWLRDLADRAPFARDTAIERKHAEGLHGFGLRHDGAGGGGTPGKDRAERESSSQRSMGDAFGAKQVAPGISRGRDVQQARCAHAEALATGVAGPARRFARGAPPGITQPRSPLPAGYPCALATRAG